MAGRAAEGMKFCWSEQYQIPSHDDHCRDRCSQNYHVHGHPSRDCPNLPSLPEAHVPEVNLMHRFLQLAKRKQELVQSLQAAATPGVLRLPFLKHTSKQHCTVSGVHL